MSFEIGDKVHVIDEDADGIVVKLNANGTISVEIDDFVFEYNAHQLMVVKSDNSIVSPINVSENLLKPEVALPNKNNNLKEERNLHFSTSSNGVPQIDLHIHELVNEPNQFTNSEMIQIQMNTLSRFISDCKTQKVFKFIVIHGVGSGVLKEEVIKYLEMEGSINFEPASFKEFGYGATLVHIRGLFAN